MDLLQLWFSRRDNLKKDDYQLLTTRPYKTKAILDAFNRDVTLPKKTNQQLLQHLNKMNTLGNNAHYAKSKDKDGHFANVKTYHKDDLDLKPQKKTIEANTQPEPLPQELTFGDFVLNKPYTYPEPLASYQETRKLWDDLEKDLKLNNYEYSQLLDRSESYLQTAKQNKYQLWQLLNLFSQEKVQKDIQKIHTLRQDINDLLYQNPLSASQLEIILNLDQPISEVVVSVDLDTLQKTRDKLYLQDKDLTKRQIQRLFKSLGKPLILNSVETAIQIPEKYAEILLAQTPKNPIAASRFLLESIRGYYQKPHESSPNYEDATYTKDPDLARRMRHSTTQRFWQGYKEETELPLILYLII